MWSPFTRSRKATDKDEIAEKKKLARLEELGRKRQEMSERVQAALTQAIHDGSPAPVKNND